MRPGDDEEARWRRRADEADPIRAEVARPTLAPAMMALAIVALAIVALAAIGIAALFAMPDFGGFLLAAGAVTAILIVVTGKNPFA